MRFSLALHTLKGEVEENHRVPWLSFFIPTECQTAAFKCILRPFSSETKRRLRKAESSAQWGSFQSDYRLLEAFERSSVLASIWKWTFHMSSWVVGNNFTAMQRSKKIFSTQLRTSFICKKLNWKVLTTHSGCEANWSSLQRNWITNFYLMSIYANEFKLKLTTQLTSAFVSDFTHAEELVSGSRKLSTTLRMLFPNWLQNALHAQVLSCSSLETVSNLNSTW